MYDNTDEIFYETNANYTGQYVTIDNVSTDFLNAIVATEDHRFFEHIGFDFFGISRAIITNLMDGSKSQGASTITQQYARLLYLNNDKTWTRKAKEAYLTMQLESHLTKDEILEGYINQVYFGHGIYGIENASYYYFGKKSIDLDLNEASILAGVVNGPSYYSPIIDMENSKYRQSIVLSRMVDEGMISKELKNKTYLQEIVLSETNESLENIQNYYFRDTVYAELDELGFNSDLYLNKGLNIYTTLDTKFQEELIQSVDKITGEIQNASIIVEPYTSKILALMGGNDYGTSQFNRATSAKRHIGSTVKPLLYYEAIENGFDATTSFLSEPTTFQLEGNVTYTPANFDDCYANKEVTLAQAVAVSDNIYAMKTHLFLGEDVLTNFLMDLGFENVNETASLALGTLDTNVYQLANAYNVIASEGSYQEIYTIQSIVDNNGNILYQKEDKSIQLLDKDSCLILSQILTGTFDPQFNTYLTATMSGLQLDNINASKTGSTEVDALSVGYNPNCLAVTWVGYDNNSTLDLYSERVVAKNILMDILKLNETINGLQWYKTTDTIEEVMINPLNGELDANGTIYWFKKKQS